MKKIAALTLALFFSTGIAFADTPKDAEAQPAKPAKARAPKRAEKADPAAIAAEIETLKQAVQAQQEELQLLKDELAKRDRQIDEARDAAVAATKRAEDASTKATEAVATTTEVKTAAAALNTTVEEVKANNEALKTTVDADRAAAAQAKAGEEAPAAIHVKGITITPGGFLAAESAFRQRTIQADVNTPFTTTPFPDNAMSRASEFNASGRQSRLSFLFEGKADNLKLTGYYELDWLGACASSNSRQSNSYCMRLRQIWGQATTSSGWSFTGGQMWSFVTETKKGFENRTEAPPMTIDAAYNVGFSWARQYGFRVSKNFNDKAWLGFAVENPQTTLTATGVPTAFFVGAPASGGGTLNATDATGYSANPIPDFIVKAAFEPGRGHYEVFGIVSSFRQRIYPCSAATTQIALPAGCPGTTPSAANPFNNTITGGGVGVNARLPLDPGKKIEFGVHALFGDGVGRYSDAQIADVTARPNGTLALIRSGGALGTIELHPSPKLDVYLNYGAEYSYRAAYTYLTNQAVPATVAVGFGSPLFNNSGCELSDPTPSGPFGGNTTNGTCTGHIRNIQEGTVGFWHKFYNGGPKGSLRWGIQYSYLVKNTWSGNNNTPAAAGVNGKAVNNMVFTSFRYYIP